MKKCRFYLNNLIFVGVSMMLFVNKTYADIVPLDDPLYDYPSNQDQQEPRSFIDSVEPYHILVGIGVLVIVIIGFMVLHKMRKK